MIKVAIYLGSGPGRSIRWQKAAAGRAPELVDGCWEGFRYSAAVCKVKVYNLGALRDKGQNVLVADVAVLSERKVREVRARCRERL